MLFQFGFYSSLLLVFFIHGLVYAILLWRKAITTESNADRWLGWFLFLSILYIAPWMLGFGGWYDTQPYRDLLFYIPFQHLYFIGPIIFFYVQSLLNPSFRVTKKQLLHLLPGLLYIIYSLVIVVTDKLVLHRYFFLSDGQDRDFDTWYQLTGLLSMIFYFVASMRYYNGYRKMVFHVVSYADAVSFRWVRNFLLVFLLMLFVRTVFFIVGLIFDLNYWDTWWYFLAFSLLYYYIAINGHANSAITRIPFRMSGFGTNTPRLLSYSLNNSEVEEAEIVMEETIKEEKAPDPQLETWKQKILQAVVGEKAFQDAELSLPDLARQLKTNVSVLSKAINQGFGMNFNDFINYYRVQELIGKLKNNEHKRQTLLGIAYDCGFNSKATFNRAFKKVTGVPPKEFVETLPSSDLG